VAFTAACGAPPSAPVGSERGACRSGGTCDVGLVCLSDLCVRPPDSGLTDANAPDLVYDGSDASSADATLDGSDGSDVPAPDAMDGRVDDAPDAPDGSVDASPVLDGGCNAIVLDGPIVAGTLSPLPPPTMTGGTIVDGTYVLWSITGYTGGDAGTPMPPHVAQETSIIAGSSIQTAFVFDTMSLRGSGTIAATGSTLTIMLTCPPMMGWTSVQYTATTTDLGILVNGNTLAVLHRL
jgi:hypothetical protein